MSFLELQQDALPLIEQSIQLRLARIAFGLGLVLCLHDLVDRLDGLEHSCLVLASVERLCSIFFLNSVCWLEAGFASCTPLPPRSKQPRAQRPPKQVALPLPLRVP